LLSTGAWGSWRRKPAKPLAIDLEEDSIYG
jgi:hypothetical protein